MIRGTLVLLAIVAALLTEVGAWAQQRPNGFYLTSPLSFSAGYDDNFVANSKTVSDSVVILTAPTFSWLKSTGRTYFSAEYEPEFELFSHNQDLNSWNHAATVRYSYRISSRLTAEAGDSLLSTSDASRVLADSQLMLPYGRFQQNSLFAGLKYRLDHRTRLFFRFDNSMTTMALSGALAHRFDQMANAGTLTLDHMVNRHHSVTGSYAYLQVRPLGGNVSAADGSHPVHAGNAGYLYTVNPGLIFRVTGGVVGGRELAYTAGGAVEKHLRGLWLMAGYQRYLSFLGGFAPTGGAAADTVPFANGLLADSMFQAVSLRVRGNLTRKIGLEFTGQRGRANLGTRGLRSLIAQSRVDYKIGERFILFARAEYYGQNVSPFSESPLSRQRFFGGLEIVVSRPPLDEGAPGRRGKIPVESREPQAEDPGASEGK